MRQTSWTRPLAGALVLLLGLTLVTPAVAGQKQAAPAKPTLAASARAQVAAMKVPSPARAQVAGSPSAPKSEKGFFKSPAGVAALVLMTAGTGYMVYSAFHDNNPVHSPFR